jgi:hypothetical protein
MKCNTSIEDSLAMFIKERLIILDSGREGTPVREVLDAYNAWAPPRAFRKIKPRQMAELMKTFGVFNISYPKSIYRVAWNTNVTEGVKIKPKRVTNTDVRVTPTFHINEPARPLPGDLQVSLWEWGLEAVHLSSMLTEGRVEVCEYLPGVWALTGVKQDVEDILEALSLNSSIKYLRGLIDSWEPTKEIWPFSILDRDDKGDKFRGRVPYADRKPKHNARDHYSRFMRTYSDKIGTCSW